MSSEAVTVAQHLALVQAQGAPKYDGYNPIAPRSHRWMMDVSETEETRVFAWILWRTIDRDPNGSHGPQKSKRTAYAHDSRVAKGKHLNARHIADDLGMSHANAVDALRRLVLKNLAKVDDEGRISPNGNAPNPRRIDREGMDEARMEKEQYLFSTEKFPPALYDSFQQLSYERRGQWLRRYLAMPEPFRSHLKTLPDEERIRYTLEVLQRSEYADQLDADAIAASRAMRRELIEDTWRKSGYTERETRGRVHGNRPLMVELKVSQSASEFSVQRDAEDKTPFSEQVGKHLPYRPSTGPVQIPHPYSHQRVSENSESEVQRVPVENLEADEPPPPPSPLKTFADEHEDRLLDPSLVVESVQRHFGHAIDPKIRGEFVDLAQRFHIPEVSVWRWIGEKLEKKRESRYPIWSPGALLEFAVTDIPKWIPTRQRQIRDDTVYEERRRLAAEARVMSARGGQS